MGDHDQSVQLAERLRSENFSVGISVYYWQPSDHL